MQYDDKNNEEGLPRPGVPPEVQGERRVLRLLHPEGRADGERRVAVPRQQGRPDDADPASEEEIIRFTKRPFWNHDGGTICFGPDGYLYISHGDGGAGNDPLDNGQNLNTLLGKILRIDVNAKADGKNYAIPKDNPFVGVKDAKPEIWAYGLRNVWRMAFDRKTGQLWAGDVGQNLYEEINLITKGGNYGWNRREGLHPFGAKGSRADEGARSSRSGSTTTTSASRSPAGTVYRGKALPELDGHYLYADYVSAKIWALKYDDKAGRVVANRPIKDPAKPVLSFGEDEDGELYFLTVSNTGKGIYRFAK